MRTNVAAIFDIGKTNRKFFLVDDTYRIVHERSENGVEVEDEDGFPSEDLSTLQAFIRSGIAEVAGLRDFQVKAVNVSAYGASFVHVDDTGKPVTPLYNYLKPYPAGLDDALYARYGGRDEFLARTASPPLGNLNSGLQLYRLKHERPEVFKRIRHSYHLPQYLAALLHGQPVSEMTSIGCHTALWDFDSRDYHDWVKNEGVLPKLPPIAPTDQVHKIRIGEDEAVCGIGIHDSSSAMVPYIQMTGDPYLLLSTGTWSICFNPFNKGPLSHRELEQDCLNYISVKGEPVRASRLFAGNMYAQGVKELSQKFHVEEAFFRSIRADRDLLLKTTKQMQEGMPDLEEQAEDAVTAYYYFMAGLTILQARAIRLVRTPNIKQIFVEGGFCQNEVFMYMLATILMNQRVYAASLPQASALGAAMVLHPHWNGHSAPIRVPDFRYFPPFQ